MTRRERCEKLFDDLEDARIQDYDPDLLNRSVLVDKLEMFVVEIEQDMIGHWTTEPITEAGWYWVQALFEDGAPAETPRIVHVENFEAAYTLVNSWFRKRHDNGQPRDRRSSRPIPMPKEAQP